MFNEPIIRAGQSATPSTPCLPDSVLRLAIGRPGRSRFSEEGDFLGTIDDWKAPAYLPLTVLNECRMSLVELEDHLKPGDCTHLIGRIAAMLQHYFIPATATNANQAEALQRLIAHDWLDAISEFPTWAVEEACRKWIRMERRRPTPAHIRDLCQRTCGDLLRTRDRLRKIIQTCQPDPADSGKTDPIIPALKRVAARWETVNQHAVNGHRGRHVG